VVFEPASLNEHDVVVTMLSLTSESKMLKNYIDDTSEVLKTILCTKRSGITTSHSLWVEPIRTKNKFDHLVEQNITSLSGCGDQTCIDTTSSFWFHITDSMQRSHRITAPQREPCKFPYLALWHWWRIWIRNFSYIALETGTGVAIHSVQPIP
jgi:hypothetical protein